MAGRRGTLRGRRFSDDDFNNSVRGQVEGRRQGVPLFPSSRRFSEEQEGGFGIGFGLTNEEGVNQDLNGRGQSLANEGTRNRGLPDNRGQRNPIAEASLHPGVSQGAGSVRGRGGRAAGAALPRGRGGRSGRSTSHGAGGILSARGGVRVDASEIASATGLTNLPRAGQCAGPSRAASEQDDTTDEGTEVQRSLEGQQRDKSGKGKNFRPEEERQLACSVINILQDPIIGNGQKGSAFWERIFRHYNDRRPYHVRPARSLETKWGVIKHDVSKFIGVLQQCSNLNVSGANALDVHKKALELYRLKTPKNTGFAFLHVWEIVKDVPRWNLGCTQEKTSTLAMKRKDAPSDSDSTFIQPSSSTDGGGSPSTFMRSRPQGSKHAKLERRVIAMKETAALAQATATKVMAEATLKKTQIMEDQNLFMLMTHSTDGVISDTTARYLKLRQEEELEKLESRLAESRARRAQVRHSPPPIPVETATELQRRVVAATGTSARSHAQQRSRAFDREDTCLPMRGSEDDIEDPFIQQDDYGVYAATTAAVVDCTDGVHACEDEPDCNIQPSRSRQQGIRRGLVDFVIGDESTVRGHQQYDDEEDNVVEGLGGAANIGAHNEYSTREIWTDVEDDDEDDTCMPENHYAS